MPHADQPLIAVLAQTSAFSQLWEELAAAVDARLSVGESLDDLGPLGEACAIVIAAAGAEEQAAGAAAELSALSGAEVGVVGVEADYRLALAMGREGVSRYFVLPGDLELLRGWLRERAQRQREEHRGRALNERERKQYDFRALIGRSPALQQALEHASRVIPHGKATLLITGETGTGKELLAHAIHYNSPRARAPFVDINCAALPENLLEAELFGYEKGAFTDARTAKPGLFEVAQGGMLFLDEIGEITPGLQAKLLRILETKQVRRLGGIRSTAVDVRIIAATHVDLAAAVRAKRFRQDLFFRLSVVPIHLPALRERGDDILLLAEHFLEQFSEEYGIERPALTPEIRRALRSYAWPGNVRELRNAMERALLLGDGQLYAEHLMPESPAAEEMPGSSVLPFPAALDTIERAAARAMVERYDGNKSAAADALGISRVRLYRLLEPVAEVQQN